MNTRPTLSCTLIMLAALFLSSCSSLPQYGALGPLAAGNDTVTIDTLKNGWEEYTVYYSTWYTAAPAALMFDPRNNNTSLIGHSWTRVKNQDDFLKFFERVTGSFTYDSIWAIVGPKKQLLGYMITPTTQLYIKEIDEKTYYVSNLKVPPSGP